MLDQEIKDAIQEQKEIILEMESKLASEDYKVLKCMEAKASKSTMPYDLSSLISRRNGYRLAINEAENEINRLNLLEPEDNAHEIIIENEEAGEDVEIEDEEKDE